MRKKTIALTFGALLLLLLPMLFSDLVSPVGSETSSPVIDRDRSYIDNVNAYISASPHTLAADGYVYLNITSKMYEGEVDFCFGFDSNLCYPRSLELYDPRSETTQHELDLNPYWDNPDYRVEYNFTSQSDRTVYDGYVWVYGKTSIFDENNQTAGWEWTPTLSQPYDVGNLDTRIVYWNTTQTLYWKSIRDNLNFDKANFSFQGMNTWYLGNAVVQKNREYHLRVWMTLVPTLEDVTSEYFVGFKPYGESLEQAVANSHFYYLDPWYNDGWQYRKGHTICKATGAGENYQVRVKVHYGAYGADSGEDVYCNSHGRMDFKDIRFTDDTGETLLDYWLQDPQYGNVGIFWVKITDDLTLINSTIYVYYGNANADVTTSNFDNTFIFGDPFDSDTLNGNRWDTPLDGLQSYDYSISTENHYLQVTSMNSNNWYNGKGFHSKPITFPLIWEGWIMEGAYEDINIGIQHEIADEGAGDMYGGLYIVHHGSWDAYDCGIAFDKLADHWAGDQRKYVAFGVGGNEDYSRIQSATSTYSYRVLIKKAGGRIYVYEDGTQRVNELNSENPSRVHLGICRYSTYNFGTVRFYAFRIRKYVSPEPAHGAWGPEEPESGGRDTWYNLSWKYRKIHAINYATGAGTNYTVRIRVHYGFGTDSGEDVYCNKKCRIDFGDVRFTDDDGETLLPYWRQEEYDSYHAVFWVKIADDLSSTNRLIYIYYGNSVATTTSNFDNTFIFGDPFDYSGSANGNRWPSIDGNVNYSVNGNNHYLEVTDMASDNWYTGKGFHSKALTFPTSWVLEGAYAAAGTGVKHEVLDQTGSDVYGGLYIVHHGSWDAYDCGIAFDKLANHWIGSQSKYVAFGVGGYDDYSRQEGATSTLSFNVLIKKVGGTISIIEDGSERVSEANSETASIVHLGLCRYSTYNFGTVRFYAFRIRKYVEPEPAHGAWGPEERSILWPNLSFASVIWGTSTNYTTLERTLSKEVCEWIYEIFSDTNLYSYCHNYWGNDTQQLRVYNNISYCDAYFNYTTVFYKGHGFYSDSWPDGREHYWVYDNETSTDSTNWIVDNATYHCMTTFRHDFVFLWACQQANIKGDISGNDSWGMAASWLGSYSLSDNGYIETADTSDQCFIGFENVSMPFENSTHYSNYLYAHFAALFYYYAIEGHFTVKNALDAAAAVSCGEPWFGDTELYKGYNYTWWNSIEQKWETSICKMRVYGDGDHMIPG